MADTTTEAVVPENAVVEDVAILPNWLDDMLKPGVGSGVFFTLKAALVSLIFILLFMLYAVEDAVRALACLPCAPTS